jgi:hypothetical protein
MNQQIKVFTLLFFLAMAGLAGCKKEKDSITIDSTSREVSGDGDSIVIQVEANVLWTVISSKSWARTSLISSNKNETIQVFISPNETEVADEAVLTFKAGEASAKLTIYRSKPSDDIYKVGALYPNKVNPIGVVIEIMPYGKHGTIVSLDEAQLPWGSLSQTHATNMDNGLTNWLAIRSIDPSLNSFPAFAWCCNRYSEYGERWYLPAFRELGIISDNIDILNATLKKTSNAVEIKDNTYWSSTESGSDSNKVYTIVLSTGGIVEKEKNSYCAVRAIADF